MLYRLSNIPFTAGNYVITHWRKGLRIAIILGAFLFAIILGILAGMLNPIYALLVALLPIILIIANLFLDHFELNPIIILFIAAFIPLSLPTGTGSRLVFSLVATSIFAGIWIMKMMVIDKNFSLKPSNLNIPIIAFIAITIFSLIWSNLFRDPLVVTWRSFPFVQAASTIVMIMLPMSLLLVANHVKDERALKILVGIIIVAGILGIPRQFFRSRILPVNTGGLYTMWVILYSAALGLFDRGLNAWLRAILLGLAGLWVYWGIGMHISWLAGWLPGLFGVGVLAWMRSKKLVVLLLIALIVVVLINFSAVSDYVSNAIEAETQESGETRLAAWEVNWRVTSKHWLFGTGPAGYAAYYMSYFPLEGTATHSNYIDIIAQTGITGLIFVLWIFLGLAWFGYKLSIRLRGQNNFLEAASNAAFAGTLGCILMMAFGDWLFPFAYTQSIAGFDYAVYNWIFMGTLLVIGRLTSPAENQLSAQPQ